MSAIKTYPLEAYFETFVRFREIFGSSAIKDEPYRTLIRNSAEAIANGKLVIIRQHTQITFQNGA